MHDFKKTDVELESTVLPHLPLPLAVSLRPSATACLSNRTSSSAYCPLPAALTPFATAVKALVTERDSEESLKAGYKSRTRPQKRHHYRVVGFFFLVPFPPSARRPADSSCFTAFPFTSPGFHHPTRKMVSSRSNGSYFQPPPTGKHTSWRACGLMCRIMCRFQSFFSAMSVSLLVKRSRNVELWRGGNAFLPHLWLQYPRALLTVACSLWPRYFSSLLYIAHALISSQGLVN